MNQNNVQTATVDGPTIHGIMDFTTPYFDSKSAPPNPGQLQSNLGASGSGSSAQIRSAANLIGPSSVTTDITGAQGVPPKKTRAPTTRAPTTRTPGLVPGVPMRYPSEPVEDTTNLFTFNWTITSKTVLQEMWRNYTPEQNVKFFETHQRDWFDFQQDAWLKAGGRRSEIQWFQETDPNFWFTQPTIESACASEAPTPKRQPRDVAISIEQRDALITQLQMIVDWLEIDLLRAKTADKFYAAAVDDKMINTTKSVLPFVTSWKLQVPDDGKSLFARTLQNKNYVLETLETIKKMKPAPK